VCKPIFVPFLPKPSSADPEPPGSAGSNPNQLVQHTQPMADSKKTHKRIKIKPPKKSSPFHPHLSLFNKVTRLGIQKNSMRQKSQEFDSDQEKLSNYKNIKIYTYFDQRKIFFVDIQQNHIQTRKSPSKGESDKFQ
jgi:hypothetical protein